MTLFLSQRLGKSGILHTFDANSRNSINAKKKFLKWKESYDLMTNDSDKWSTNVKFGCTDFNEDERLDKHFSNYYDAIYLDMANLNVAISRAYRLLKPNGVLVINGMHLTQILGCMNTVENSGLGLEFDVVIEPSNRFWELRKIIRKYPNSVQTDLNWTCRLEDTHVEKLKRGGLCFNYWPGFLAKFRKIR
jgi:tRNA A58 N-methylase Trm61